MHDQASATHAQAAQRHENSAAFWAEHGDDELAALERRNARIEWDAAELEADRARLLRQRGGLTRA
jgi:hypothetical protein